MGCDETCTADCGRCKGTGFGRGDEVTVAHPSGNYPAMVVHIYASPDEYLGWRARVMPNGDTRTHTVIIGRLTKGT